MIEKTDKPAGAMLKSLDMTDERDRGLLRRKFTDHFSKHRRWGGVDEQLKADAIKALRVALGWALQKQDHRAVNGIVDTLKGLEGQNQADEHLMVRMEAESERPVLGPAPSLTINIGTPEEQAALAVLANRRTLPQHPAVNGHANGHSNGHVG